MQLFIGTLLDSGGGAGLSIMSLATIFAPSPHAAFGVGGLVVLAVVTVTSLF
jgi:hypothetical protein